MSEADRAFVGAIPEIYDRLLGPMLFEPYARDLAARFKGFDGELLETAAGTGRVTRALAEAAPLAAITATDLNAPMLAKAADCVRAANVRFEPADAQALPFPDQRFEAVVCQFGVMFFPDKAKAFTETQRVLRPNGRFVFNVWDDLAHNDVARAVHEAVAAYFPDDPPGFLGRTPYGWHDRQVITAALTSAGFRDVQIEAVALPTPSPSAADAARGLCLGSPLRGEIEARSPDGLEAAAQAATEALQARFGDGPISGAGQALVVVAIA
ncbi:methyltransferase domain-containing protein [Phenylobacterium sp. LjRoot219]|uniref:class I SAM-dependent methyltransferase n=1 Tax=Phenylobacterium sp. LjRoot219 TaxID=3342283 RepID=UPI003ECF762E